MKIKKLINLVFIVFITFILSLCTTISYASSISSNDSLNNTENIKNEAEPIKVMKYDARTNTTTEIFLENKLSTLLKSKSSNNGIVLNPLNENVASQKENIMPLSDQGHVYDTSVLPYKGICQISYDVGIATGSLIGSKIVLTCAHCVFNKENNQKFENWNACLGKNGSTEYGNIGWSVVYYSPEWMNTHNQQYDWAVCVLNDSFENINNYIEVLYYDNYNALLNQSITNYGYPKSHGGSYLYSSPGTITKTYDKYFKDSAYVEQGYSGGPVLNSENRIVGIIKGNFIIDNTTYGIRIDNDLANTIISVFNEYQ